jgi:tripartite-type tricarboxylate transporter receptor subunit TctC
MRLHLSMKALCAGLALTLSAGAAMAQAFPSRPVKIVTPFPPGSGPDVVMRLVSEQLSRAWGQPVLVDNKPGGSGVIAFDAVKRAPADGYTFLQADNLQLTALPHLMPKLPYDVVKDFDPVAVQFRLFFFVAVPSNSKWNNMSDLIADAKAKPGELTYGSWNVGSPGHLGAALLEGATGTQMRHIPFKETSQLYSAVAMGAPDWAFGSAVSSGAMYKAGKIKYIAVAGPKRIAGFENVPTMAEAGGPASVEVGGWMGFMAPRGTPVAIVNKVNEDMAKVLQDPAIKERFASFGFEPITAKPAEVAKMIEVDSRKQGEVIRNAKISIE